MTNKFLFVFAEIKLREHGSESIEVSDNGIGVQEENFQGLSKILVFHGCGFDYNHEDISVHFSMKF